MVAALGGPADFLERHEHHLGRAPVIRACLAERAGFIAAMETRQIGIAAIALGGGRRRASDPIDPLVGFAGIRGIGSAVAAGEPLAFVHAANEEDAAAAIASLRAAIRIADTAPPAQPVVRARVAAADKAKVA